MKCLPHTGCLLLATLLSTTLFSADLPNPQAYLQDALNQKAFTTTSGEQLTWHIAFQSHDFLDAFAATDFTDVAWLRAAQQYFNRSIQLTISDDPDGYPGTIGADIGEDEQALTTDTVADTLVGDANIALPLVHFAQLIRDHPELQAEFSDTATRYQELATRMLWDKWNARDCYYQDARGFGSYHTYPFALDKSDRTAWQPRLSGSLISDNLNKHYKAGLVFLSLWQLTDNPQYRDRVCALFGRAKAMFRYIPADDRVAWNFWMPHGPYDMAGSTPKSWVGVHPNRPGYQAFEAGAFLAVYDAGLVFSTEDMQRIVRTNVWMIQHHPSSADGTSKAGTAWGDLSGLDPTIRAACLAKLDKNPIPYAYVSKVLGTRNGYQRLHVGATTTTLITDVPLQPGQQLSAAYPVPDTLSLANGDRVRLFSRIMNAGDLRIELCDASGATVLGTIAQDRVNPSVSGGFYCPLWDGTNPKTGSQDTGTFLIRWTLNNEVRTWPISIITGIRQENTTGPADLAPGATLTYNFEHPLDPRWHLEGGAEIADAIGRDTSKALRIGHDQTARLTWGTHDDAPVTVSLWVFDGNAKHGTSNASGPDFGLVSAGGDIFALQYTWRRYLSGDTDLAWFNTGENQWFSPHPCGIKRRPGWNAWTFDATLTPMRIAYNGTAIEAKRLQPARFIPTGSTGLIIRGPGSATDPAMIVDDVVVVRGKR